MKTLVVCLSCGVENRVDAEKALASRPVCGKCGSGLDVASPGHPVTATDASFGADVLHSGVPTLVDFWADWCGPCKVFAPTVDQFAREMAGKVRVVKVNVDACPNAARQYNVGSIPTVVLFREGEVGRLSGAVPIDRLRSFVNQHVGTPK